MHGDAVSPANPLNGQSYYLAVGSIGGRKNTIRLLDAFAAGRRQGLKSHLILAGTPGQGWMQIQKRLNREDVKSTVHVYSGLDDPALKKLYKGARGLLFPSLEEGFGLPILEAFSAGIPVLTSNGSAMREVAADAALLIEPERTTSIVNGLIAIDTDKVLRASLVSEGKKRLAYFTAGAQANCLLSHLNRIRD